MATEVQLPNLASVHEINNNTTLTADPSSPKYPDPEWSTTTVNYYQDSADPPPDTLNSQLSEHEMRLRRRSDDSPHITRRTIHVRNMRGHEADYSLEKQGCTIAHLTSQTQNWHDEAELKRVYFPEIAALLKRVTGAQHVFQYEHHVRTATLEEALTRDSTGAVDIPGPVRRVHIDESPASVWKEFEHHVRPHEPGNEHLRDRPVGVYNVWKPLRTVRRDPLCICDTRTILDEDLAAGKVTVPAVGEIENFAVRAPPGAEGRTHSFAYLRAQRPDEALVFRIFDSRVDAPGSGKRSHGAAHTSFVDPGTEGEVARESVEVRSFCVF